MRRLCGLAILVLCLGLETALADTIPPDPIIDMEPGTGTVPFGGTFTFTVNTTNNPNCSGEGAIVTCGNRNPQTGQLFFFRTPVLGNITGKDIVNLDFVFSTAQAGFQPGTTQDSDPPHTPLFTQVTPVSAFEAIYQGSVITHNCSTDGEFLFCDTGSEFTVGFAEFFAPANGIETITIRSNVSTVPEPQSAVLLFSGLLAVWGGRKRFFNRHQRSL